MASHRSLDSFSKAYYDWHKSSSWLTLCGGNSSVTTGFLAKRACAAESAFMTWRLHVNRENGLLWARRRTPDIHWPAFVIRIVSDGVAPSRHQALSIPYTDSSVHESYYVTYTSPDPIIVIKQTIFERGRKVGIRRYLCCRWACFLTAITLYVLISSFSVLLPQLVRPFC